MSSALMTLFNVVTRLWHGAHTQGKESREVTSFQFTLA